MVHEPGRSPLTARLRSGSDFRYLSPHGDRKMCAVVPHILPKGGSGAAPLLDTPARMTRFTTRTCFGMSARSPSSAPYRRCATRHGDFALPGTPSSRQEMSLSPCTPIDQRASAPPGPHGQGCDFALFPAPYIDQRATRPSGLPRRKTVRTQSPQVIHTLAVQPPASPSFAGIRPIHFIRPDSAETRDDIVLPCAALRLRSQLRLSGKCGGSSRR